MRKLNISIFNQIMRVGLKGHEHMDCLYALKKIELDGELGHYVG